MSKVKQIYLAGGIQGLSFTESKGWRDTATELLLPYIAISPLCLEGAVYQNLSGGVIPQHESELQYTTEACRYIVWKDLEIIKKCNAILVNISKPSFGTAMEIFYAANNLNMPVVAWGNVKERSPWIRYHVVGLFDELNEACNFIKEIFAYDYA